MLTHIRKHLDLTIGCPICGKGFQNAASIHKHDRKAHAIQIVAGLFFVLDIYMVYFGLFQVIIIMLVLKTAQFNLYVS